MNTRLVWGLLSLFFVLFYGCSETLPQNECLTQRNQACICPDGSKGKQVCSYDDANPTKKLCQCSNTEKTTHKENMDNKESIIGAEPNSPQENITSDKSASKPSESTPQMDSLFENGTTDATVVHEVQDPNRENKHLPKQCQTGQQKSCYRAFRGCKKTSSGSYQCVGHCKAGVQTCNNGHWSDCKGEIWPSNEIKDGKDNNCDGTTDEHFTQISSGHSHTCGLLNDGRVKCWGSNYSLLLGSSKNHQFHAPVFVHGLTKAKQISSGGSHSCALLRDGTMKCWGTNSSGQLGNGTYRFDGSAEAMVVKQIQGVKQISVGSQHTCALLSNGTVKCWGSNYHGQLGNGTTFSSGTPKEIHGLSNILSIAAESNTTCALDSSHQLFCWGQNSQFFGTVGPSNKPQKLKNIKDVKHFSFKEKHMCVQLQNKEVQCWGSNDLGQLGINYPKESAVPVHVKNLSNTKQLSAGSEHTCSLLNDGTVKCWGSNDLGQLGIGNGTTSKFKPTLVKSLQSITQISTGYFHTCALLGNGTVKCWGKNDQGQLGQEALFRLKTSIHSSNKLTNVKQISAGAHHSCAVFNDGTVKCWGKNDQGQLGDGTTTSKSEPILVKSLKNVRQVSVGTFHTCAVQNDNVVKCWGLGKYGQLGDGTTTSKSEPTVVGYISNVKQVSTGLSYTCATQHTGVIGCWGNNERGQVGQSSRNFRLTTITKKVDGLSNATQVLTGKGASSFSDFTCALLKDGTVKCWGGNAYGQIGQGFKNYDEHLPSQVKSLTNVKQLTLGAEHACVLLHDGKVKCWGSNDKHKLGMETSKVVLSLPEEVKNVSNTKSIVAGFDETCVILKDHTVKCWGLNAHGQLGVGHTSSVLLPTTIKHLHNVKQLSIGQEQLCAVFLDHTATCWGKRHKKTLQNLPYPRLVHH